MQEIRSLASHFSIPVHVHYCNEQNRVIKSSEIERKSYLLDKIYRYIQGERTFEPIVYSNKIVSFAPFKDEYAGDDLILYRDFKSTNKALITALKKETDGAFYFGALAFIEAHKIWRQERLVTLAQFGVIWLQALQDHVKPLDEWTFIRSMQAGMTRDEWKVYRSDKAQKILAQLLG